jgi:DNA-directed RNA polymerase specialized sigma24 family protein
VSRGTLVQVPSADGVSALVARLADRAADLVLRTGVAPERAGRLVETSAMTLVTALATDPSSVADPAGVWFATLHADAVRARDADPPRPPPAHRRTTRHHVGGAAEADPASAVEQAFARLDERRALALLLRDSYDLPWASIGPALGVSEQDGVTVVAEARQQLLQALDGTESVQLAAHGALSGISYATLAQLADADAVEQHDPLGVARAQHVRGCTRCAEFIAAQRAARRALAALPVRALPDVEHERIVRAVEERATSLLPSAASLQSQAEAARPPSLLLSVLLLAGAAAVGVTIGALVAHDAHDSAVAAPVVASSAASPSTAPPASATPSATPSTSPSVSASPASSPTALAAPSRTAPTSTRTSRAVVPPPTSGPASQAVPAAITLSPTGGPAGTVITVSGVGFTPGDTVTVTYRHGLIGSSSSTATVAADGTFVAQVTANDTLAGSHLVTARDQHGISASSTFEQG